MIDRLRAGPVTRVGGLAIIPIAKVVTGTLGKTVCGAVTPVAVVILIDKKSVIRAMDGSTQPTEWWLEAVPGLGRLIAEAAEVSAP